MGRRKKTATRKPLASRQITNEGQRSPVFGATENNSGGEDLEKGLAGQAFPSQRAVQTDFPSCLAGLGPWGTAWGFSGHPHGPSLGRPLSHQMPSGHTLCAPCTLWGPPLLPSCPQNLQGAWGAHPPGPRGTRCFRSGHRPQRLPTACPPNAALPGRQGPVPMEEKDVTWAALSLSRLS